MFAKLKMGRIAVLAAVMVFLGSFLSQAADDEMMTNAQFASLLANVVGLKMPAGAEKLSDTELYEIQANMLAERGITLFIDAKPDTFVTRCDLATVLYDALIGPNETNLEEKIDYLIKQGYLSAEGEYVCNPMSISQVASALNVPELSAVIAEAYSAPRMITIGARGREVPPAPFNPESATPPLETAGSPTF